MPRPSDLIAAIRGELGARDGRKYWDAYWGGTWAYVDGSSTPYCACGVSWALRAAGVTCEGFPRAVAIDRRDGFSRMVEPSDLEPGDIVGFDWDWDKRGDHVGVFVEWMDRGAGEFRTLEFNSSEPVGYHIRHTYQVTCGVRPDFDGEPAPMLEVDGIAGPATIRAWQDAMGTGSDGIISDQLAAHDRFRRNVWAVEHGNGRHGSALVRAVQRRVGANVDGDWGENTSRMLQLALKDWGYYGGPIDGDFAHHSVCALQRSLNDGRW